VGCSVSDIRTLEFAVTDRRGIATFAFLPWSGARVPAGQTAATPASSFAKYAPAHVESMARFPV
jgi:hypothetical protein